MASALMLATMVADRFGMMDDGNGHPWMWLWGGLMMLLIVAGIGIVVWAILRSAQPNVPRTHDRAREILAERYARGEITSEEYRERSQQLG
ncbi:MAG: SHOCT domain-containing protein [Acidimicrobiia bacterium]